MTISLHCFFVIDDLLFKMKHFLRMKSGDSKAYFLGLLQRLKLAKSNSKTQRHLCGITKNLKGTPLGFALTHHHQRLPDNFNKEGKHNTENIIKVKQFPFTSSRQF